MRSFVFPFNEINKSNINLVGGKGASLGELSKIEGTHVPDGFCISTEAYKKIISESQSINKLLDHLSLLKVEDRNNISKFSGETRRIIEDALIPQEIKEEVINQLSKLGETNAYAVRSSATAEDLPTASFAGQQDTYLNIIGEEAILKHISKCWASLFTERAIIYRIQNGFDHRKVYMSVVIQKMVFSQAAGILFTADPITSNRKVLSIDASFGLGEALVSGLVNADIYKIRNDEIIDKKISNKKLAIYALKHGGTKEEQIKPELQNAQTLTDEYILQLERIGRKIEEHFRSPQDIEWCLADDKIYIVQSRPITTLFPVPEANDQENHVYVSVGHQQMMTDAMKPLGLSFFNLDALRPMYIAGGRLFVDVAPDLATPAGREILIGVLGKSDPLVRDALTTITERGNFLKPPPDDQKENKSNQAHPHPNYQAMLDNDPTIVSDLVRQSQTFIEELKNNIQTKSGSDLFDFILADTRQRRKSSMHPQNFGAIMTSMNALSWINENIEKWLGEKNVADTLAQSVSNNITSEMGLELLDVADAIRPYPEIIDYLQHVKDDSFLDELVKFDGGQKVKDAINNYLDKYGMRCEGEIDITRTRWSEKPTTLLPLILSNIKNFQPGAGKRKFDEGLQEALKKEKEILERLRQLPDGEEKAKETKRMIDLLRNFAGYREYPKYHIVSRYLVYKQALLKEAERLVQANIIKQKEDIFYLTFEELHEVVRTNKLDYNIIRKRKDDYKSYEKLTPPRVMTSEGEIITGTYKREDIPSGAIVGLPVSAGAIEGRARIILKIEKADLEEGDILITKFTDPSWTPVFVSIKGLVTEVGGLMSHGAVIAREYGLPAVTGVDNATKLIKDGQQIRVHGTEGYIEIL